MVVLIWNCLQKILNYIAINNPMTTFQLSLDKLVDWSAESRLSIFNIKCSVSTINRSDTHTTNTTSKYYLDGSALVMDLGIQINLDLSFQFH